MPLAQPKLDSFRRPMGIIQLASRFPSPKALEALSVFADDRPQEPATLTTSGKLRLP